MTPCARMALMVRLAQGKTRREFDAAMAKEMPGWTVQRVFQEYEAAAQGAVG